MKRRIVDGIRELGGIARALVVGQHERLMDSRHLLSFAGDENAAAKMSSSGGRLFAHRNFIISGASYRKILKIGPFCFGVAAKLGAKFAGPLIIIGKGRCKRAKESNCPKTRTILLD